MSRVAQIPTRHASERARLIVAASEHNADMLHLTGFRAPDPFAALQHRGRTTLLLNDLEIDRARTEARDCDVASYSECEKGLRAKGGSRPEFASVLAAFLKGRSVREADVPADFPLGLAAVLRKRGVRTHPVQGAFVPERMIKSPDEIRMLRAASRIAEVGMARGMDVLATSKIRRNRRLAWGNGILTSERLRMEIEMAIVRAGGQARGDTIVACGEEACDPHARGSGPLRAGELIILDIFPRDAGTGYFGDITRTVVRGRASEAQRRLWQTCLHGQRAALRALKPGVDGAALQKAVSEGFAEEGYPTEIYEGHWRGFFHGLGHGLGLEVHEDPRISAATFRPGIVITIEPGIYWPGVGGVRHEDVAVITETGHKLLTRHPKPLEI